MNIYAHTTYKAFPRDYIASNDSRGIITSLAEICGCDRTYISQVLNGKAELTPDHMIQFCEHLNMTEADTDYAMLLLLRDRSSSLKVRKNLDGRIAVLRKEAVAVSTRVLKSESPNVIQEELGQLYYSSWQYGAIHILTSIDGLQTPVSIAQKLQLPLATVTQTLKDLVEMKVVRLEKGKYVHSGGNIYLPGRSAQSTAHHLGWRMKAVERAQVKDDVHYTLTFSVSDKDVEKLRNQIIKLIEDQRKVVRESGAETACAFCVDFFTLG